MHKICYQDKSLKTNPNLYYQIQIKVKPTKNNYPSQFPLSGWDNSVDRESGPLLFLNYVSKYIFGFILKIFISVFQFLMVMEYEAIL